MYIYILDGGADGSRPGHINALGHVVWRRLAASPLQIRTLEGRGCTVRRLDDGHHIEVRSREPLPHLTPHRVVPQNA